MKLVIALVILALAVATGIAIGGDEIVVSDREAGQGAWQVR
jgi:hypothetical protein